MSKKTVGEVVWLASIDSSEYKKGKKEIEKANKELEASGEKTENKVSSALSKMGKAAGEVGKAIGKGLVVAGTAIAGLATLAVKSYADYEQLVGGVDTLFKDSSQSLQDHASQAFKTVGISANQYMEQATSFSARLIQGLAGDTEKAVEYSHLAITDMADNANKMGTSMDLIQNAYQGFAKQNFMMLDNLKLGYGQGANEMARLINDSGVLNGVLVATAENVKDIPFQYMIQGVNEIQKQLGITGATVKEAEGTISGSFKMMKASFADLTVAIANPEGNMEQAVQNVISSVQSFGRNVVPIVEQALGGIVTLISDLVPKLLDMLPPLLKDTLPKIIDLVVDLVIKIVEILPDLIPILIDGTKQLLFGVLRALDLITEPLIEGMISLFNGLIEIITEPGMLTKILMASVKMLTSILEALPQIIDALVLALPDLIVAITDYFTDPETIDTLIKYTVVLFGAIVSAVPLILGSLAKAFGVLLDKLWETLKKNFVKFGADFGGSVGDAIKGGINGVLGWINNTLNGIIGNVNSMLGAIDKIIPGDQSRMRIPSVNIPRLAEGGIVTAPTLAMVGEGGEPEAIIPLSQLNKIINNSEDNRSEYNITVNMSGIMTSSPSDERAIAKRLIERVNEELRAKNKVELAI